VDTLVISGASNVKMTYVVPTAFATTAWLEPDVPPAGEQRIAELAVQVTVAQRSVRMYAEGVESAVRKLSPSSVMLMPDVPAAFTGNDAVTIGASKLLSEETQPTMDATVTTRGMTSPELDGAEHEMIVDVYHADVKHTFELRPAVGEPFFEPKLSPLRLRLDPPVTGAFDGDAPVSTGPS